MSVRPSIQRVSSNNHVSWTCHICKNNIFCEEENNDESRKEARMMNGADEAAESKPNTILHALYFLKSTSEALSIPKRTVRWKHLPLLDKARLPDYPRLSSPFNSIQPLHPLLPSQSIQPVLHHTESVLNTQCNWQTPLCVPVPKKPNLGLLRQGRTKEEEEEEEEKEEEKEKKEEAKKTKEEEAKNEEKEEEAKWKWLLYIHAKISRASVISVEEEEKMKERGRRGRRRGKGNGKETAFNKSRIFHWRRRRRRI